MITEDRLIGWLCMARLQFSDENPCSMPRCVSSELFKRGWMRECDGTDGCESWNAHLTDRGAALSDMYAPEWGIDPLVQETA